MVEHHLVGGRELPVRQYQIGHVDAEFAAFDAVAGVLDGIRRQRWQLQVAHDALDVQRQRRRQRVDLAQDLQRRRTFGAAPQLQIGQLRLALRRHRGKRTELAGEFTQVGRVVGLDKPVGEKHLAVDQAHRSNGDHRLQTGHRHGRRGHRDTRRRGGRCTCRGLRGRAANSVGLHKVLQVDAPVRVDDDAGEEVPQRGLGDSHPGRVARGQRHVDTTQAQGLPVQQFFVGLQATVAGGQAVGPEILHHQFARHTERRQQQRRGDPGAILADGAVEDDRHMPRQDEVEHRAVGWRQHVRDLAIALGHDPARDFGTVEHHFVEFGDVADILGILADAVADVLALEPAARMLFPLLGRAEIADAADRQLPDRGDVGIGQLAHQP